MNDREFPYKPYKARFRMRDVVETVLTLDRQDSTGAFFFCPFHADGENGNLHVQDAADHVTCFSGGCRFEGGDIFDFLTAYFEFNPDTAPVDCARYLDGGRILQDEWHLSNDDLARLLRGDFTSARIKKSAVRVAKPKEFQIAPAQNFDQMRMYETNLERHGMDYWLSRGLTYETMKRFHLGYDPEAHRHVIPNCNHVGVYGLKRRRDDAWAKADMLARGERWLNAEKDSIWQRRLERADALSHVLLARGGHAGAQTGLDPEPPTDEDVYKKTYPKFIWGKAGENTMWLFNEDRLLNGSLLYVFLTSAEVDTITLEQYGYPSVAWASDAQFPEARDIIFYSFQGKRIRMSIRDVFRSALHIYIVADNDASGLAAARKRREALGRGDIISTPFEKDVNDYCRQHAIAEWLPNAPPLLENRPYHA